MNYLGLDPGATGGLVCISDDAIDAVPTPRDEHALWSWISKHDPTNTVAVIEEVAVCIFGAGKSSSARLYGSYCQLRAMLVASTIPFESVKPSITWRYLSIEPKKRTESKTQWKSRLKNVARTRFPHTKVTLAIADALLISFFCKCKHRQNLSKNFARSI